MTYFSNIACARDGCDKYLTHKQKRIYHMNVKAQKNKNRKPYCSQYCAAKARMDVKRKETAQIITGKELKARRERLGLYQFELAEIMNRVWNKKYTAGALSRWETQEHVPMYRAKDIDALLTELEKVRYQDLKRKFENLKRR